MPAEWEPHRATWISWPHHEPDWPGKLGPIPVGLRRDRARARRARAGRDPLPLRTTSRDRRAHGLEAHAVRRDRVRLHVVPTDRVWLRDSAPTGVLDARGRRRPASGPSTAGRSTDNWHHDAQVGRAIAAHHRARRIEEPRCAERASRIVLEGGGIDVNGRGLLLVTEEWLLSDVQVRNPGLGRGRLRGDLRGLAGRAPRRSGSAKAASATTRTATSTTSRGSCSATRSCSPSKRIRRTRTTRGRWTTCAVSSSRAPAGVGRFASSRCRFRGR